MKILIFSDSHGNSYGIVKALAKHRDAEVVFFLGDGLSDIEELMLNDSSRKWLAVRGNCDFSGYLNGILIQRSSMIELCGKTIAYTHGDAFSVKSGISGLLHMASGIGADIVLFGHTHVPTEQYVSDDEHPVYLFNPGSISMQYGGGSYGILTLTENTVLFSHGNI